MIVEYIRYQIPADRGDEFDAAYAQAAHVLRGAPECVDYELTRCTDEPVSYVMRIVWTSEAGHLEGFRRSARFGDFLGAIKAYVPDVQEMRHYRRTGVHGPGASVPSLYDWSGGDEALGRLTEAFYQQVVRDDLLQPLFAHMDRHHPAFVAMWLAEVFGGPARYTAERGGYAHMLARHLGKAITEPQRRRWINLLADAADEVGLPSDPEFRAAFMGYIEWGTRLAVANSQSGAHPVERAPVPHWGWGVAPPYQG